MPIPLLLVIGVVAGLLVGALVAYLWVGNKNRQRDLVSNAEREKLLSDAETQMKEMVLEAKEEAHRIRLSRRGFSSGLVYRVCRLLSDEWEVSGRFDSPHKRD